MEWERNNNTYRCHIRLIPECPGYSAIVVNLPGCASQGCTVDDAIANVREAIDAVLHAYRDNDMEVPWKESTDEVPYGCIDKFITVKIE